MRHAASLTFAVMLTACGHAAARPPKLLAGSWHETFETRSGCSDSTTITVDGESVAANGKDCEDKRDYAFSDVAYDGKHLSLKVDVPTSNHHVRYRFDWLTDDDLAGEADVTTGGGTKTYRVRWTREKPKK